MKIAFDSWPLAPRFRHQGTHVYATNLITEFKKAAAGCNRLEFCFIAPMNQPNGPAFLKEGAGFSVVRSALADHERTWRLYGASVAGKHAGADVMFSPSCNVIPLGKLPMVCTIHDVTPMVLPCNSRRIVLAQRFFLRSAARRSKAIITVSECSKRDLVERCGVPEEKITVVHNGYDRQHFNQIPEDRKKLAELRARFQIRERYVWHHGVIQPRKNLPRLIEAWQLLVARRRDLDVDLVLAGLAGWQHEHVYRTGEACSGSRGKVVFPGALSSEELAQLVKGAALVAVPSLYEGFCLPMVEAMACGVPTIVSDNSCFREISDNALVYFDPLSIEDIAAAMEAALCDSDLRAEVRKRGLRRAADFSWERCGRETLNVLLRAGARKLSKKAGA